MKKTAKNRISEILINKNLKHVSITTFDTAYKNFEKEVQAYIKGKHTFNESYTYLMETRFYFMEIKNGYYQQLELFSLGIDSIKKKNFI